MQSAIQTSRLGDLLIERHAISQEQLAIAIAEQKRRREQQDSAHREPTALGEILVEFNFLDRKQLRKTLKWQQRLRRTTFALAFVTPFLTTACGSGNGSKEETATTAPPISSTQGVDSTDNTPQAADETANEQKEESTAASAPNSSQQQEPVEQAQPAEEPAQDSQQQQILQAAQEPVQEQIQQPAQEEPAQEQELPEVELEPVLASAKLSWTIPQSRENGEDLQLSEIEGYEILYKKVDDEIHYSVLVEDPTTAEYVVDNLPVGEYEFMIASYDTDGVYSAFTKPVYKSVQ